MNGIAHALALEIQITDSAGKSFIKIHLKIIPGIIPGANYREIALCL
jgi:hypothetical protein